MNGLQTIQSEIVQVMRVQPSSNPEMERVRSALGLTSFAAELFAPNNAKDLREAATYIGILTCRYSCWVGNIIPDDYATAPIEEEVGDPHEPVIGVLLWVAELTGLQSEYLTQPYDREACTRSDGIVCKILQYLHHYCYLHLHEASLEQLVVAEWEKLKSEASNNGEPDVGIFTGD